MEDRKKDWKPIVVSSAPKKTSAVLGKDGKLVMEREGQVDLKEKIDATRRKQ